MGILEALSGLPEAPRDLPYASSKAHLGGLIGLLEGNIDHLRDCLEHLGGHIELWEASKCIWKVTEGDCEGTDGV